MWRPTKEEIRQRTDVSWWHLTSAFGYGELKMSNPV